MSDDDTPNELSLDAPGLDHHFRQTSGRGASAPAPTLERGSQSARLAGMTINADAAIVPARRDSDWPHALDGHLGIRDASTALACQARRELLIFSHDLDPRCYDHRPFLAEVRRLALERPHLPVRALVVDARTSVTHGHRMIDLARRLTSRIEVRRVAEDDRDRIDAFLVVDARGYCRRPVADRHEAIFAPDDPPGARRLQADFQAMWEQAEPDTELRRLHL